MALFPRFSTLPPAKVANPAKVEVGTPGRDQNFRNSRNFRSPTAAQSPSNCLGTNGTVLRSDDAAGLIDILERAAILEFCNGLQRTDADARALREFGFASWEAVLSAQRGVLNKDDKP